MNVLVVLRVLGVLFIVLGTAQLIPAEVSWFFGEGDWGVFLGSAIGLVGLGCALVISCRKAHEITNRDGFLIVTTVWISACLAGAVPLYISGAYPSLVDAIFESMSGFTTTGASVLTDYAALSHGVLIWRSMTQWFGGMGIIVLALAVMPTLGIAGMQLFEREVPGPYHDKITPRLRDTAKALWSVYVVLTAAEVLILMAFGMGAFDALNHSMATLSTGGFGTRIESVAAFASPAIEWTVITFMFLASMNFALHYRFVTNPTKRLGQLRDTEWRWYVIALLTMCLVVSVYLYSSLGYPLSRAFTKGFFQVVSIATTTGFASDDYVPWGTFPHIVLLFAMFAGGCAGSTSGGVKWVRLLLVFKNVRLDMLRLIHPNAVVHTKINNIIVTDRIQRNITSFLFMFIATIVGLTTLISLDGHSFVTSLGAAISALGNIGPAMESLGPTGNYAALSDYVKLLLVGGMLLGRLELMTVVMLFNPHTWRK